MDLESEKPMIFIERVILKAIKHKVAKWFDMEKSLTKLSGVNLSVPNSPTKSWPDPEKIEGGNEVPFSLKICQSSENP